MWIYSEEYSSLRNVINSSLNYNYLRIYRYKKAFIKSGLLKFINTFVQFFPSLIIAKLLKFASASKNSNISLTIFQTILNEGFYLSFVLFACLCTKTAIENQYFDLVINLGANIRGTV